MQTIIREINQHLTQLPLTTEAVVGAAQQGEWPTAKLFAQLYDGIVHWDYATESWRFQGEAVPVEVLVTLFINKCWPTGQAASDCHARKNVDMYVGSFYRVCHAQILARALTAVR